MSTANDKLVKAIQRMAMSAPEMREVRSLLKVIRNRGGIDGLYLEIGGIDGQAYKDCCSGDKTGEESPGETAAADITGDAPPDMSGGIGDDWTDCTNGQSIQFSPQDFTQAETCKECGTDDTWVNGSYAMVVLQLGVGTRIGTSSAANEAVLKIVENNFPRPTNEPGVYEEYVSHAISLNSAGTAYTGTLSTIANFTTGTIESSYALRGNPIACLQADYASGLCTLDAPEVCGKDWIPDGITQYTVRNGCIVASKCDTDASGLATGCNECISVCEPGGKERQICGTSDGGYIVYDPSGTNKGGKYSAEGARAEVLDAGETGGYVNNVA